MDPVVNVFFPVITRFAAGFGFHPSCVRTESDQLADYPKIESAVIGRVPHSRCCLFCSFTNVLPFLWRQQRSRTEISKHALQLSRHPGSSAASSPSRCVLYVDFPLVRCPNERCLWRKHAWKALDLYRLRALSKHCDLPPRPYSQWSNN